MSTKSTVAYGDNFHLYEEGFEENVIYLGIEKPLTLDTHYNSEFPKSNPTVTFSLSKETWNEIVKKYIDRYLDDLSEERP